MILEEIEQRALAILTAAKGYRVPVPVEALAAAYKIMIRRAPHSKFSGMLIRKNGHALIGVSSSEATVRQRFTIAHELGHFFLHPRKDTFVDYRDNKSDLARTPREREANTFAAALLMPRDLLRKDCKALAGNGITAHEIKTLARRYNVSEDAMRFRLLNLKVVVAR